MTTIVGLIGAKRAGKDTFAKRLIEEHGFVRFAFADAMKDALYTLNPFIGVEEWVDEYDPSNHGAEAIRLADLVTQVGWDRAKEEIPEVRRLIQVFGTEVGRQLLGDDVWVEIGKRHILDLLGRGESVVVTDVRFPNEHALIASMGGVLARIERPGLPDTDTHVSETAWRDLSFDWIVQNDRDIDYLYSEADFLASALRRAAALRTA